MKAKINNLLSSIFEHKYIYLMLVPGLAFLLVFKYFPMYGIQLAFKRYMLNEGITGSPWIGLENFLYIWSEPAFWRAFKNTIVISLMKLGLGFPIGIILALLINELKMKKYRRFLQTIYTFPHFLSWVIVSGIIFNFLGNTGALNSLLENLGLGQINFLMNKGIFRYLLVYSEVWKEAGWSTILYLAAIAGIDPTLYEAATVDGANRWHKIKYITWPGIQNIVVIMFIMTVGSIMVAGFNQVFNLYNEVVYDVGDIISTYVYRISFQQAPDYGVSTAVGLFNGVVNFMLLMIANTVAKKFGKSGII
ncbi:MULTISPECIES: sugar ABC transporter permease [Halanaerobium]|jgi:putative aldouronate transport system permease protein|uniref:Carbohydrate ABC transporter membrane protein 1 (CUT1 family) n=1 Tax=Halanaerobium saccharolyticum TaxID=43595 RepID=A0A2T5RMX0_9FIRM|nr:MULTISPECIES: ABC transporter permease subunit [Halanaerobium]PTW00860.1 carbohydrate ABC transporter membrane protein 1 (CUT1 family) [Halanaerobium saccharolyticum]RCW61007.1 carbohydrate ABC transporter membrane protein 1 (CUT1 family) [Halanaerobium sp. ST460_2HS_T2]TDP88795.1 carbohydrate ABC transporter membrane protein 1 (CUT1 family) [Halanaerobium saccharolyticum]